jgi:phenylacetic acid degradation operon negative regulatory protein
MQGMGDSTMNVRSIVIDLFGDYLRYNGGEVRLQSLASMVECFDVGESTLRVVMARLRRENWLDTRRQGRETIYSLNELSWRVLDEGRARIFDRMSEPWSGEWSMVIYSVPEKERAVRESIRRDLAWLGFGPLATSTWISPHQRLHRAEEAIGGKPLVKLELLVCRSGDLGRDRQMAASCWDLQQLNTDYTRLIADLQQKTSKYGRADLTPQQALVERVRLTHEYRKFPYRDPDLPAELLPAGWKGRRAHAIFLETREQLREKAEEFVSSVLVGPQL